MYIRGCLGCILVGDATNNKSLSSLLEWKSIVLENSDYFGEDYSIPFIVLENKVDLIQVYETEKSAQLLKEKEAKLGEFVKNNGFSKGFLTSAKENINLNEAFTYLSEKIYSQLEGKSRREKEKSILAKNENQLLDANHKQKKSNCC